LLVSEGDFAVHLAIRCVQQLRGSTLDLKYINQEAGTTLDYDRRESVSDPRCIYTFSGQGTRLSELEVSGVDTTRHNILGLDSFRALG
jgi:hypothetical protein